MAGHVLVEHKRLAGTQHVRRESGLAEKVGSDGNALAVLVDVRIVNEPSPRVVDANVHVGLVEDLADLVADGIVDALHVQLGGKRLLHAVDDRQFRGALLALLEQALRLVEQSRVLQGHAHARGDGAQQAHLRLAERGFALIVFQHDLAQYAVAAEYRDVHQRQRAGVGSWMDYESSAPDFRGIVQDLRPPGAQHALEGAIPLRSPRFAWRKTLAMFHAVEVLEEIGRGVVPGDAEVLALQHDTQLVAYQVDDRLEVKLRRHAFLDAVDHRQFGVALFGFLQQALCLVEEARILERNAHAVGERLQQPNVRHGKGVFLFHVEQVDEAARLVAGDQRNEQCRFFVQRAGYREAAVLLRRLLDAFVDDQRLSGTQDMRGEAHFRKRRRIDRQSLAVLVCVRIVEELQLGIEDADVHVRVVEDLPDLVSDRVVDTLDVELGCQRRLHTVDDCKLGIALFGFLEQALRLVEQTGILERHAHAGRDGRQQAHVGIAEGVLAFVALHDDASDNPVAADDRHL